MSSAPMNASHGRKPGMAAVKKGRSPLASVWYRILIEQAALCKCSLSAKVSKTKLLRGRDTNIGAKSAIVDSNSRPAAGAHAVKNRKIEWKDWHKALRIRKTVYSVRGSTANAAGMLTKVINPVGVCAGRPAVASLLHVPRGDEEAAVKRLEDKGGHSAYAVCLDGRD